MNHYYIVNLKCVYNQKDFLFGTDYDNIIIRSPIEVTAEEIVKWLEDAAHIAQRVQDYGLGYIYCCLGAVPDCPIRKTDAKYIKKIDAHFDITFRGA